MIDRNELIEVVTRQVLATLAGSTPNKAWSTPEVVANGAARIGYCGSGGDVPQNLARYIDHTLLKPDATPAESTPCATRRPSTASRRSASTPAGWRGCAAPARQPASPWPRLSAFRSAPTPPRSRPWRARRALRDGAREIDMVINIGALKGGDHELVRRDIAGVSRRLPRGRRPQQGHHRNRLPDRRGEGRCLPPGPGGRAHFVKTSTGFGPGGATVFDVALMREVVGDKMGVKAAGGIHTAAEVREMITAGATRIGASAGVKIVSGEEGESGAAY